MSASVFVAHASSVGADYVGSVLDYLIAAIHANEHALNDFFRTKDEVLNSPKATLAALALFLFISGPRAFRIRALALHYRKKHPLPAYRQGHVRNVDIETVRDAIGIYMDFLVYLVAVGLLKVFWACPYLDIVDFLIQLGFFGAVLGKVRNVEHALHFANESDADKQARVSQWLGKQLDGLNLSLYQISRNVGVVALALGPLWSVAKVLSVALVLGALEGLKSALT